MFHRRGLPFLSTFLFTFLILLCPSLSFLLVNRDADDAADSGLATAEMALMIDGGLERGALTG